MHDSGRYRHGSYRHVSNMSTAMKTDTELCFIILTIVHLTVCAYISNQIFIVEQHRYR